MTMVRRWMLGADDTRGGQAKRGDERSARRGKEGTPEHRA